LDCFKLYSATNVIAITVEQVAIFS